MADDALQNRTEEVIDIRYESLKKLRDTSNLIPGVYYRITDYVTKTSQPQTTSAEHQFDLIVQAISCDLVSENARAVEHEGENYFANSHLSSWTIKYVLDNDSPLYGWGDTSNGKGIIYYMQDEFGNECPYDFKNIQFLRREGNTDIWCYTFSYYYDATSNDIVDASIKANDGTLMDEQQNTTNVYNNRIKEYKDYSLGEPAPVLLNSIVFLSTEQYDNRTYLRCFQNVFDEDCHNITLKNGCNVNRFGKNCYLNTFGNECSSNEIGGSFIGNDLGDNCSNNIFSSECTNLKLYDGCSDNTFSNSCSHIVLQEGCTNNTFENYCSHIELTNHCSDNKFEYSCDNIIFDAAYTKNVTVETNNKNITLEALNTSAVTVDFHLEDIIFKENYNNSDTAKIVAADNYYDDGPPANTKIYEPDEVIPFSTTLVLNATTTHKDVVRIENDGDVYVYNIGGYDGTDSTVSTSQTLQAVIGNISVLEPMVFKGSVGTGGTVEWANLPSPSVSNKGWTYKVITAHDTVPVCEVGDTIISDGTEWVVIPSGDEPGGTVTSVDITNGPGITVSGSPITTSGTITVSHADTSSQTSVSNSGRTYIQSVTLDSMGHVTALSSGTETVTDTTYTLGTDGNNVTLTPSTGSQQSITVPYATNAGTASAIGSSTVGSQSLPVYINSGTPAEINSLSVSGDITSTDGNLSVSGTSTLTGNVTASNKLTVNGDSSLAGSVFVDSTTKSVKEGNTLAFGNSSHSEGNGTKTQETGFNITGDANAVTYTVALVGGPIVADFDLVVGDIVTYDEQIYAKVTAVNKFTTPYTFTVNTTLSNSAITNGVIKRLNGVAYGNYSHSEGNTTKALGDSSHTEGIGTLTLNANEHAEGQYNKSDTGSTAASQTISSIGIGTNDSNRKNAVEVMKNGDVYINGIGSFNGNNITSATTLQTVIDDINTAANTKPNWIETSSSSNAYIQNKPSITSGTGTNSIVEGLISGSAPNIASGDYAHAEGNGTTAEANNSHAEGEVSFAFGYTSHVEGGLSIAAGDYSHSEGFETLSVGEKSHAEGRGNSTSVYIGTSTDTPGTVTYHVSSNYSSIHVGDILDYNDEVFAIVVSTDDTNETITLDKTLSSTTANNLSVYLYYGGAYETGSHVEGYSTLALNESEHAEGQYNVSHTDSVTAGKTISSVGIGTSPSSRQNAVEVMKNGDVYIKGIGSYNGTNPNTNGIETLQDVISDLGNQIANLPTPMVFKGSVGTGGTVEWANLPIAASGNSGWTYKVITAHDTAPVCGVGDTIISDGSTWVVIPSGDEPSGTVTSVAATGDTVISISGSPITTSGTLSITHGDSGASAGSYGDSTAQTPGYGDTFKVPYVTVNAKGHVTGISEHTVTIPASDNTDRYVNSAAFADNTASDADNPVKMTLTRAGSDSATVTANIPKVSSSSAGVVPKGTAVSTQSQSTKFLREDGSWAVPSYTTDTNTTYTLGTNGNNVTLTPSTGSQQSITVPYATNAGTAAAIGSSTVGSQSLPVYINAGTPTEINSLSVSGNISSTSGNLSVSGTSTLTGNTTVGGTLSVTGNSTLSSALSVDSTTGAVKEGNLPINTASGNYSHAEGSETTASAQYAHAEGQQTTASGQYSHAEGRNSEATASATHAEGYYTQATNLGEHAEGRYNASHTGTTDAEKTVSSIGVGTATNNRKNAFEIMRSGDVYVTGVGGYDGTNPSSSNTLQTVLNTNISNAESITYSSLKTLRDNSNLVPGKWYRITDYDTTTAEDDTDVAGHSFDVIVVATSVNALNENAYATLHSGDTYFVNSKLENWLLKYCIDNDVNRFSWAEDGGTGVIYYMKDEWNNECPYDFKNILFYDNDADDYFYTFNYDNYDGGESEYQDLSLNVFTNDYNNNFIGCSGNVVKPYFDQTSASSLSYGKLQRLNFIYFKNIANETNDEGITYCNYNNFFDFGCRNIVFDKCCSLNRFGFDNYSMTFGKNCNYNTLGQHCYNNTFGINCSNNTLGNSCYSNTFGDDCTNNTLGNNCYSNTFGDNCYNNTFGIYFYNNILNDNLSFITAFENVYYCRVGRINASGNVRNALILSGTYGASSSSRLDVLFTANQSYTQVAGLDANGNLQIWIATDIVKKSGDTMTGYLTLSGAPTQDLHAATKKYVDDAITALPEPMIFKGSVGTGGTVEWANLPSAASGNEGWTYKVITEHTTTPICKEGDTIISDGTVWIVIPSGDEPSGTVTSVAATGDTVISISGSPITSSGTLSITHGNSGAAAGSYGDSTAQTPGYGDTFKVPYVTVDAKGHVTGISEHTVAIPASDNTNTTYTLGANNNTITLTPSSGNVQSVTVYSANLEVKSAQDYVSTPEFKEVKINGSTTNSASTENCVMQYDTTNKCVKFVFN